MKNSIDTIGIRSRDLPVCSAVPQPRHRVFQVDYNICFMYIYIYIHKYIYIYIYTQQVTVKVNGHTITGHENPEGSRDIALLFL
jgi:hypothetical protein